MKKIKRSNRNSNSVKARRELSVSVIAEICNVNVMRQVSCVYVMRMTLIVIVISVNVFAPKMMTIVIAESQVRKNA